MPLASTPPDPAKVTPGIGALVVFIFLLVAGYFLFRSLRKQLKRVDFPEPSPDESGDGTGKT